MCSVCRCRPLSHFLRNNSTRCAPSFPRLFFRRLHGKRRCLSRRKCRLTHCSRREERGRKLRRWGCTRLLIQMCWDLTRQNRVDSGLYSDTVVVSYWPLAVQCNMCILCSSASTFLVQIMQSSGQDILSCVCPVHCAGAFDSSRWIDAPSSATVLI